ncbi:hypothetical protein [Spirosoma jeollabukense]
MRIYIDPFGLQPVSGALEVTDDASYVAARQLLLAFIRSPNQPGRDVVVRHEPWTQWFDDLPTTLATHILPLAQLRDRWPNVAFPSDLTDKAVQELGLLLSNDVEPTLIGIAKHFFGESFHSVITTEPATVYSLARFVAQKPPSLNKDYLRKLWSQYLDSLPPALEPLKAADATFARILAEGIYLGGLPELISDWEHENALLLKKTYQVSLSDLQQLNLLSWSIRPFKATEADLKLEQKVIQLVSVELKKGTPILDVLKGRYVGELQALISTGISLNPAILQSIEFRYADILSNETYLHGRLRALVIPELLEPPTSADLSQLALPQQLRMWQEWATTSFIPYKFWLDLMKQPPVELVYQVEEYANTYGDWLFAHYETLIDDERILTSSNVRQRAQRLLSPTNSRLIWLIVDGLPDAYTWHLTAALKKHGLNKVKVEYALATLPTITAIGIPALLNGLRPNASSFIPVNRREALVQAYPDHRVVFANQVRDFADTLAVDADLCCLHWRELDSYQHKEDREIEGTRAEHIGQELDKRIGLLAMAMRQTPDRRTRLLISTDHGATRCLRSESGISNKKIKDATAEPHERCIKLVGKLADEELDVEETYHLTKSMTHNQDDWVAARGYRYFGRNDSGYRHGGLTPEETIVPVLMAEASDVMVNDLLVSYFGTKDLELGKTFKEVQLRIHNPNTFAVELRGLSIAQDTKSQFNLPSQLGSNGNVTFKGSLKLPSSLRPQNGYVNLNATLEYVILGESYTTQATFPVPIQQSNELDDFDFDSL